MPLGAASELQPGGVAQFVGVVAVLVAQGDLVHALADLLQPRVLAAARIAVVFEERGPLLG